MMSRKEDDTESFKEVEEAWEATNLNKRLKCISGYHHRLSKWLHQRSAWQLTDANEPEQPSQPQDRRLVQYLLEFLELDGLERRFGELLGKKSRKKTTKSNQNT